MAIDGELPRGAASFELGGVGVSSTRGFLRAKGLGLMDWVSGVSSQYAGKV